MEKVYKIYKITNLENNMVYIGQTTKSINHRFKQHIKYKKSYISKAIGKYGKEKFSIEWIATSLTHQHVDELEDFFILTNNSLSPNGYNLRLTHDKNVISENLSEIYKAQTQDRWDNDKNTFHARPIVGINIKKEILEFDSINSAVKNKIYPDLNHTHKYYRTKGYYFFYREEFTNEELFNLIDIIKAKNHEKFLKNKQKRKEAIKEVILNDKTRYIVGVNPITKDILRYNNINQAKIDGVASSAIYYSLYPNNEKITRWKGYHFFHEKKYTIEEMFKLAEERNDLIYQRYLNGREKFKISNKKNNEKLKKPIIGINPITLEYKIFDSGSSAKKEGYSIGAFNLALKGMKRRTKGMHFQYYTKSIEEHIEIVKALYF